MPETQFERRFWPFMKTILLGSKGARIPARSALAMKMNGKALCHSMNATQWVRDPTMDSSDIPFEALIKPCVSDVRHLGIQCRRGGSGIPPYGFHKNLTVSTKPAKKLVQMQIPTQFACPNRSGSRAGPAAGRVSPRTYQHVHQIVSHKTIGNQRRSSIAHCLFK